MYFYTLIATFKTRMDHQRKHFMVNLITFFINILMNRKKVCKINKIIVNIHQYVR